MRSGATVTVQDNSLFLPHLEQWGLVPDGAPILTLNSRLLPVRRRGQAAMLKLFSEEERVGGDLMAWWAGDGAAAVLAHDDAAVLLERAEGTASLADMAREGRDDEACRILCAVAARLHAPRDTPVPSLTGLPERFYSLMAAAPAGPAVLAHCADTARSLLAAPREMGVLHGDLHHENVLDFGPSGWRAIDPKGLIGERGFDFTALFRNPDGTDLSYPVAVIPERFRRRVDVVAEAAGLERDRLLRWVLASAGLSAAWSLEDGMSPDVALTVAELATALLDA